MKIIKDAIKKSAKDFFQHSKIARNLVLSQVMKYLEKDPEKNAVKIFEALKKGVDDPESKDRLDKVCKYYEEMPAVKEYITKILKDIDSNCLKKFFINFFGNATWYGIPRRAKLMEEHDTKLPFIILLSPSMKCNLKCTGCYASNYDTKGDMTKKDVFRVIKEAIDMGVFIFTILGGEPFFTDYLIELYETYPEAYFITFTNGTLFTEEMTKSLVRVGNCMPMVSLEGFEEATDERRGKGVFKAAIEGMRMLKKYGVPFGTSTAVSNQNIDIVTSDEFADMLIKEGSLMLWYFLFMPVGDDPQGTMDYMLSPEQRIKLGRRGREIRSTKPIYTLDFFNDAPFVGGCIAGKFYCHINAKGDLEPCIFSHFSTENVRNQPLLDAFKNNALFKAIRKRQPYNDNLLQPCPMIDTPEMIREVVKESGAYSTDGTSMQMIEDEVFMDKLEKLAADFKPYADETYEKDFKNTGNYRFGNFEKGNTKNVEASTEFKKDSKK